MRSEVIRVYVGWDRQETVAFWVLAHSIIQRSSEPVAIIPLNRKNLRDWYWRPRDEKDSTDFSNSRWIIPALQGYEGKAIFMDCDMLCLGDIAELWHTPMDDRAILCRMHNHTPKEQQKFLGRNQFAYSYKNWSSLMLMDCSKLQMLTRHIVNTQTPGLWFHQYRFLNVDEEMGDLGPEWNLLVNYDDYSPEAKLVHWTSGGPWHGYDDVDYASAWRSEYEDMVIGDNPVRWYETTEPGVITSG